MRRNLIGRLHARASMLCTECCSVLQTSAVGSVAKSRHLSQSAFSTNRLGRNINRSIISGPISRYEQPQFWRAFSTSTATKSEPSGAISTTTSLSENDSDDDEKSDLDDLDILQSGKLPPAPPAIEQLRERYIPTKESEDPQDKRALLQMYRTVARDPDLLAQLYPVDFLQAMYAAKALHSLPKMREIIDDVGKTSHRRHPSFYHVMLHAYMIRNDLIQSDKIWKLMKQRKVELTQTSYHIMLRHCKARRSTFLAMRLLREMEKSGIPVSEYTYVLLLGICYRRSDARLAQQLFDEIPARDLDWTAYHFSTLLGTYVKAGDRAGAFRTYDAMLEHGFSPNTVIFNSLLSVVSDREERHELYNEFLEQRLQPNVQTLISMRLSLKEILDRMEGKDVSATSTIPTPIKLNVTREDFNFLLTFALKSSKTGLIQSILDNMKKHDFQPDAFTFSTLMDAFVKIRQYRQARVIFEEIMASDTIVPDVVVYTNAISAALGQSDTMGALQILKRMLDDGLMPNAVTMNQLLTTMVRGGEDSETNKIQQQQQQPQLAITTSIDGIEMAELVVDLMHQNGIREDIRSFNILLSAYARANEPEKMMRTFHRMVYKAHIKPELLTYETLIVGHLRSGNLRYAVDTYFTMRENDLYAHSAIHNQLLSALVASGQAQQTLQLWRDISRSGRSRDEQSFKIMFDACERFQLLEQRHEIEQEWIKWKTSTTGGFDGRTRQHLRNSGAAPGGRASDL
ncbi:hypothetical protein BGW41_003258 [Actinomortierella wolfii]|nr:hypothetical protein BGW41_003258 [Actinomortierella wolfii]